MNARVDNALGTIQEEDGPATHKYGIQVFGALSIKRNPVSLLLRFLLHPSLLTCYREHDSLRKRVLISNRDARVSRTVKIRQDICDTDFCEYIRLQKESIMNKTTNIAY